MPISHEKKGKARGGRKKAQEIYKGMELEKDLYRQTGEKQLGGNAGSRETDGKHVRKIITPYLLAVAAVGCDLVAENHHRWAVPLVPRSLLPPPHHHYNN